eukprot:366476-Chlamydomonas_euryale.AAC.14
MRSPETPNAPPRPKQAPKTSGLPIEAHNDVEATGGALVKIPIVDTHVRWVWGPARFACFELMRIPMVDSHVRWFFGPALFCLSTKRQNVIDPATGTQTHTCGEFWDCRPLSPAKAAGWSGTAAKQRCSQGGGREGGVVGGGRKQREGVEPRKSGRDVWQA